VLSGQPQRCCAGGPADRMSLFGKKKVAKRNGVLEIPSMSFRVLHTPASPRNRFIGKRMGGG